MSLCTVVQDYKPAQRPSSTNYLAAWTPEGKVVGDKEYHRDEGEGKAMLGRYTQYMQKEGALLEQYMGRRKKPHFVGSAELPEKAVAANVQYPNGLHGIVSARNYDQRVAQFAANHHLDQNLANTYVLAHEQVHLLDPELRSRTEVGAERYVEATLLRYFTQRAIRTEGTERDNYQKLATTAKQRLEQLKQTSGVWYHAHAHRSDRAENRTQRTPIVHQEIPKAA